MTDRIRVGPVDFWVPCGVAGIRLTFGGCGGSTEEGAGAGAGAGTGTAASPTFWTLECVV